MVKNTIPLFPLWVQYGFLHRAEFLDISDGSEMALRGHLKSDSLEFAEKQIYSTSAEIRSISFVF